MTDQPPNEEAKVGRFILRVAAATAWFIVFWLVRFRTVNLDISDIMRTIIAIFALLMGILTLYWAMFSRDGANSQKTKDD